MLAENYGRIDKVRVFLELMKSHEVIRRSQRKIERMIHKFTNVLCDFEVFINNPSSLPSPATIVLIPMEYRNLTRTQSTSWAYVLMRDLKTLLRNGINHYATLSSTST